MRSRDVLRLWDQIAIRQRRAEAEVRLSLLSPENQEDSTNFPAMKNTNGRRLAGYRITKPNIMSSHSSEIFYVDRKGCSFEYLQIFRSHICSSYEIIPCHIFLNAQGTWNKMVHKKRHSFLAQFSIPFHMVWSVLLRVLAQKNTFWLVEILY